MLAIKPLKSRLFAKMRLCKVDGFRMQLITSGVTDKIKIRTQRISW